MTDRSTDAKAAHAPLRLAFAQHIVDKFVSAQSNAFLLHGNTKDVFPLADNGYVPLLDFLIRDLIKPDRPSGPRTVIVYDPATGIAFHNPADSRLIAREIGEERLQRILDTSRTDILTAISALRELTRLNIRVPLPDTPDKRIRKDFAIIIRHGEAVAPAARGDALLEADRLKVLTLENWFSDNRFVASSDIVLMIAETLGGVHERIVDLPYISAIKIDRPSFEERKRFIEHVGRLEQVTYGVAADHIAHSSAGLSLLSIRQIVRQASYKGEQITPEIIFEKTKEIIEKELEGHIEFPFLTYGFEKVVGASRLLKKLRELVTCLKSDDPAVMPIGILVPGANGVGKTFIYKAFAKECGWIAVVLKNIRGQYVGQTEQNWERIRSVLEAMSNVMVLYDEADTEIAGRGPHTHDVDRRLFGRILAMMSDQANRGRIVWIIITARPDKLEPDLKRSGRAGEHLPVFDSEGEEKEQFLRHVLHEAEIGPETFSPETYAEFVSLTERYFPADFDQLITELKRRRLVDKGLTQESVIEEVRDFIPSSSTRERLQQELLAVLECTSREILPPRYADVPREIIQQRLSELQASLGAR
ncbi:MAG: ATP-binding protein [Thermodesulfobacteriota bacterium]